MNFYQKKKKSKKEKKNTVDASQGSKMSNGKSYNMLDGHDLLWALSSMIKASQPPIPLKRALP